jgi:hypothetical protein
LKRTQRINQAVRETVFPQAHLASISLIDADGDAVNVAEVNREKPLWVRLPTSAGVRKHGMVEEKCRELGRPSMLRCKCSGKSNNEKGE